jgi:hypothetical protein
VRDVILLTGIFGDGAKGEREKEDLQVLVACVLNFSQCLLSVTTLRP